MFRTRLKPPPGSVAPARRRTRPINTPDPCERGHLVLASSQSRVLDLLRVHVQGTSRSPSIEKTGPRKQESLARLESPITLRQPRRESWKTICPLTRDDVLHGTRAGRRVASSIPSPTSSLLHRHHAGLGRDRGLLEPGILASDAKPGHVSLSDAFSPSKLSINPPALLQSPCRHGGLSSLNMFWNIPHLHGEYIFPVRKLRKLLRRKCRAVRLPRSKMLEHLT